MGGDDKHKDLVGLVRKPTKTYWKGQPDLNRFYYTTNEEEEDTTTEARPRPAEAGPAEVQGLLCDQPWACDSEWFGGIACACLAGDPNGFLVR